MSLHLHLEFVGLLWFKVVGQFLDSKSVDVGELLVFGRSIKYWFQFLLLNLCCCHVAPVVVGIHRLVSADQPFLGALQWLGACLLPLVADLSELLLAVLGAAVLLGLLGTSLHLKLVDFLQYLSMAVIAALVHLK